MSFHLNSTANAIAIIPPPHLHSSINEIRSIHDKAYHKWPPHINLLYPFVDPASFSEAVERLRQFISNPELEPINVKITAVDIFQHRKNATIYLKPENESEEFLRLLRKRLADALGCSEREGTHDGEFRPHLTVGQASLNETTISKLREKAATLANLQWTCKSLVALRREPSGEMNIVAELPFGIGGDPEAPSVNSKTSKEDVSWRTCHSFTPECGWSRSFWPKQHRGNPDEVEPAIQTLAKITVSSYNLLTAHYAPSLDTRFPLIIEAISSLKLSTPTTNVLCLQEVGKDMLPLLLSDPFIQESYPYSTHHTSTHLPNQRNLVTLSSVPFTHCTLQFVEHHKSALIVNFGHLNIQIANVHLTSALTDKAVLAKKSQMAALTKFFAKDTSKKEVFVAGDFNLTTSASTVETALSRRLVSFKTARSLRRVIEKSFWEDAFEIFNEGSSNNVIEDSIEGEEGATFDRMMNPLAAMSEGMIDNRPQRYDRVLFRKGGQVHVESFGMFGLPAGDGTCASDHYGITTTLDLRQAELRSTENSTSAKEFETLVVTLGTIDLVEDDTDLQPFIAPHLPTESDQLCHKDALDLVQKALTDVTSAQNIILAPLGSYAMDTYFSNSDIDVLVIGLLSADEFFDFAPTHLQNVGMQGDEDTSKITGVHLIKALVPIIELNISNVKFDLQYCQAPELVQSFYSQSPPPPLSSLVSLKALLATLNPAALFAINAYRDMVYLRNTIPHMDAYRTAHRYLLLFLKRRGLYSAKFGYLGGIQLTLMLNRVVKLISSSATTHAMNAASKQLTHSSIVRTFLSHFSKASSYLAPIRDPDLPCKLQERANQGSGKVSPALMIPPLFTPAMRSNTAYASTPLTVLILRAEFSAAASKIAVSEGIKGWEWCLRPRIESIHDFFSSWKAFVRIRLDVWENATIAEDGRQDPNGKVSGMAERVRKGIGAIESRISSLMLALGRIDGIDARVWPGRFCETDALQETRNEDNAGTELGGWYFIGVSPFADTDASVKKEMEGRVMQAAKAFEQTLRTLGEFATNNDDPGAWVNVDIIPRKAVKAMDVRLDERDLAALFPSQMRDASTTDRFLDQSQESEPLVPSTSKTIGGSSRLKLAKLPPAQDVISRIRWDPSLSPSDFVVGYSDRFAGVQEIALTKWKMESTDLEFIPMHRVMWIRRKGDDGEKVWDRVARKYVIS